MIFFVWIGIFNLMIVAQFWSFANDVYSKEEGERLLVIVGLGASLGAVAGARVADRLIEPFGVHQLMLLGAARARPPAAAHQLHRPGRARAAGRRAAPVKAAKPHRPRTRSRWCSGRRYLLLMALMLMMINWINTTGEYILGGIVKEHATAMIAAGTAPAD